MAKRLKVSASDILVARWCCINEDGSAAWEADRLKSLLTAEERQDRLFVQNLVIGNIVTGRLYPLIFDCGDREASRWRSLQFFRELLANPPGYQSLTRRQQEIVGVGVRDLFFAGSLNLLTEEESSLFRSMVDIVDDTPFGTLSCGFAFTFHPTKTHKVLRFSDELRGSLQEESLGLFVEAGSSSGQSPVHAVFINAQELSYHNFENLLPLDRALAPSAQMQFQFQDVRQPVESMDLVVATLGGDSCSLLRELDGMQFYNKPLNDSSRGGVRFVFQSSRLSQALREAVRASVILGTLCDASRFQFVNSVFRCNKFEASDAPFSNHRDTPYFDKVRSHISKYTLLVYINEGSGDDVLSVEDWSLNGVAPFTCVIFHQRYEHSGKPFREAGGAKVFLRSELIFEEQSLSVSEEAKSLFSTACYMSGQSLLQKELSQVAHDAYERVNALHWGLHVEKKANRTFVHKRVPGTSTALITDGFDYWLPRSAGTLKECALIAVLDYFNCKLADGASFRSLFVNQVVTRADSEPGWMWKLLQASQDEQPHFRRIRSSWKEAHLQELSKQEHPEITGVFDDGESSDEPFAPCCPSHWGSEDDSCVFPAWNCWLRLFCF
eukprot:TRINITY_DN29226_c0_g1_i1.p1 TRINITY_DN29226_c0_g1~~TRINITY_DN29226_c0_g1_i1.p1  ORF type:complete len:619 (-),score=103.13 TRINITY_DN29226_c0_g1_i1:491-2317(-)